MFTVLRNHVVYHRMGREFCYRRLTPASAASVDLTPAPVVPAIATPVVPTTTTPGWNSNSRPGCASHRSGCTSHRPVVPTTARLCQPLPSVVPTATSVVPATASVVPTATSVVPATASVVANRHLGCSNFQRVELELGRKQSPRRRAVRRRSLLATICPNCVESRAVPARPVLQWSCRVVRRPGLSCRFSAIPAWGFWEEAGSGEFSYFARLSESDYRRLIQLPP